ncbi:MAG: hypothetical protein AB7I24_08220 [Candidatus Nanopelagicales bacterium]|jgi:hypothetical protein
MQQPLVDLDEFSASLPADAPSVDDQSTRATWLLAAASALVRTEARRSFLDEAGTLVVPDQVVMIVCAAAGRAWMNPTMSESVQAGPFANRWGARGVEGVYLTDAEKQTIADLYPVSRPGVWSLSTTRGDYLDDTAYQPVDGTDEPFPWWKGEP